MNPEESNKQAAPTTVGGVTFGGGGTPAPAPEKQNTTPVAQAQPGVDPIVASTGEEFDAVMSGIAGTPARDFNQAPIPNTMSTQVASPTHFDSQNTVKPIVLDPGNPNVNNPQAQQTTKKKEKTPEELDKQVRKFSTMAVIFGILTAIFTVLAVVALVLYLNTVTNVEKEKKIAEDYKNIIAMVEEKTGVTINTIDDVPEFVATTGYIYLSDWNIKIQIPDNLEHVSYIYNNIGYHSSICFNAVGKGVQQFPDFANIALHPGKMGCLTRIETTEGEFDAITGNSYGEKVFTYKDYSYFYTGPTFTSKDDANLGLEKTATQYIYSMLKDKISKYE
jgi:cell division protein FtsL